MTKSKDIITIPRTAGTITATSWTPPAGLTFEQWKRAGLALASVRSTIIWVLADWWVHGEHHYGERLAALRQGEISDLKFETIMDYGTTARKVGTPIRNEVLSFSHHRQVRVFDDPEIQRQWLDRAAANDWTVRQLHDEIEQSRLPPPTNDGDATADAASEIGAPITGNGDDHRYAGDRDHGEGEHPAEPESTMPPAPPPPEEHDRHLLATFHQFAGGLYFLVREPLRIFEGTRLTPSRLRTVAHFLETVADAIEGRRPKENGAGDELRS